MNTTGKVYQFWFEFNGKRLQLPMTPEKITIKNSRRNESVSIADFGEITLFKDKSPEQISFSGIFPGSYFPGCTVRKPLSKYVYTRFFTDCLVKKMPVRFTVTQCGVNGYYTVEEFTYSENGGDVGTVEFSLSLKEYKSVQIRQIKLEKKKTSVDKKAVAKALLNKKKAARASTKTAPETYTVKAGDCLWNLAKKFYGNGSKFMKIYEVNKKIIGANPNKIKAGQVLKIP